LFSERSYYLGFIDPVKENYEFEQGLNRDDAYEGPLNLGRDINA